MPDGKGELIFSNESLRVGRDYPKLLLIIFFWPLIGLRVGDRRPAALP